MLTVNYSNRRFSEPSGRTLASFSFAKVTFFLSPFSMGQTSASMLRGGCQREEGESYSGEQHGVAVTSIEIDRRANGGRQKEMNLLLWKIKSEK